LELQPQRVYLLASDGLWRLEDPLDFIHQWPRLLLQPRPLEESLAELFAELERRTLAEPYPMGDNCTAVALRVID
ncbi:MAG: protein phosphatase, partial [Candidatus Competibacteraceae bacterium]|nr:protein phosphatase [Candidatus Competibacteraceae bacterium]